MKCKIVSLSCWLIPRLRWRSTRVRRRSTVCSTFSRSILRSRISTAQRSPLSAPIATKRRVFGSSSSSPKCSINEASTLLLSVVSRRCVVLAEVLTDALIQAKARNWWKSMHKLRISIHFKLFLRFQAFKSNIFFFLKKYELGNSIGNCSWWYSSSEEYLQTCSCDQSCDSSSSYHWRHSRMWWQNVDARKTLGESTQSNFFLNFFLK